MKPRLSARFLFAAIGAIACVLAALALEGLYAPTRTSRWVDDHETPVLLFFSHYRNETERRLQEANAKSGDVEITLTWNNLNDLDLHCIDPTKSEVFYGIKKSLLSGGELDIDQNSGAKPFTSQPVEHIVWPHGRAPAGPYKVFVDHYARHGALDPTPFQVIVKEYGRVHRYSGQISHDEHREGSPGRLVAEFTEGSSRFAFGGLQIGFWRALFVIGCWAAVVTAALGAALLAGLHLFYRRIYRKRLMPIGKAARITIVSTLWGGLAGVVGQTVYAFLPSPVLKWHPTDTHVVGLLIVAAIAGLALSGRIPHLKRGWALLAGLLGGGLAGFLFLKVYWLLGESARSEMWGRVAAAAVIGAFIGWMIALIVEPPPPPEEPVEYADASLDTMQPLSLRANRIGPTGKLRRAGHEPANR